MEISERQRRYYSFCEHIMREHVKHGIPTNTFSSSGGVSSHVQVDIAQSDTPPLVLTGQGNQLNAYNHPAPKPLELRKRVRELLGKAFRRAER